ncbi:MAG TPA: type II toxin-antitoxin system Phd/YefM family antitoxin [Dermatophilaceae bacterium]|nr:type II toxin-antitoxin system Phd/YefM family antitoxin [Dermatophilaceae bacterium]
MTTVKVQYAKTHLSALLARVEGGEEIVIARGSQHVAKLVPLRAPGKRALGFLDLHFPDDVFVEPLPEDELAAWEADEGRSP